MNRVIFAGRLFSAVIAVAALAISKDALAGMPRMGRPLPTTVVITKPAIGQAYGDQQVVTFGVKNKTYKFILVDAWVDDPQQIVHWPDIWQQVIQYRPNFQTQGMDADVFEKFEPGQTVTVRGMYAPNNETFEVVGVEQGNVYQPPPHY